MYEIQDHYDLTDDCGYFPIRLLAGREELVLHRGTRNRRAAMGSDRELWLQLARVRVAEEVQKQLRGNVQTLALSQAVITIAVAR